MRIKISSPLQLATHFKSLRRAKGWSQNELGQRLGISQSRIAQIEANPELISVDKLIQILHVLDAALLIEFEKNLNIENAVNLRDKIPAIPKKKLNSQPKSPIEIYRHSSSGRFVVKPNAIKNTKATKW